MRVGRRCSGLRCFVAFRSNETERPSAKKSDEEAHARGVMTCWTTEVRASRYAVILLAPFSAAVDFASVSASAYAPLAPERKASFNTTL